MCEDRKVSTLVPMWYWLESHIVWENFGSSLRSKIITAIKSDVFYLEIHCEVYTKDLKDLCSTKGNCRCYKCPKDFEALNASKICGSNGLEGEVKINHSDAF